jgi:hypothetical protein
LRAVGAQSGKNIGGIGAKSSRHRVARIAVRFGELPDADGPSIALKHADTSL